MSRLHAAMQHAHTVTHREREYLRDDPAPLEDLTCALDDAERVTVPVSPKAEDLRDQAVDLFDAVEDAAAEAQILSSMYAQTAKNLDAARKRLATHLYPKKRRKAPRRK